MLSPKYCKYVLLSHWTKFTSQTETRARTDSSREGNLMRGRRNTFLGSSIGHGRRCPYQLLARKQHTARAPDLRSLFRYRASISPFRGSTFFGISIDVCAVMVRTDMTSLSHHEMGRSFYAQQPHMDVVVTHHRWIGAVYQSSRDGQKNKIGDKKGME